MNYQEICAKIETARGMIYELETTLATYEGQLEVLLERRDKMDRVRVPHHQALIEAQRAGRT